CADMQLAAEERLGAAGYRHYETSAFAKPGRHSRHNLNYWEFGDYIGIGAGAHGKLSFPDRVTRHARIKQPREYLAAIETRVEDRPVESGELPFEFMLNALRLTDGFEIRLFQERTGLPLGQIAAELGTAEKRGLLERDWQRIRPSERGRLFLNELLELFLPAGSKDRG
ncbi:MAG TPA: oxygen-independent coproporphyrinogen III oxidase-like protein, partial [Burkholderiales bacterium]|nr:oxygen-independent coproporphyrinogen III oxidase-like protein [Burkholderiales bacterium]